MASAPDTAYKLTDQRGPSKVSVTGADKVAKEVGVPFPTHNAGTPAPAADSWLCRPQKDTNAQTYEDLFYSLPDKHVTCRALVCVGEIVRPCGKHVKLGPSSLSNFIEHLAREHPTMLTLQHLADRKLLAFVRGEEGAYRDRA